MIKGLFVTGTSTGVGKTFITSLLLKVLRGKGVDAVPVKPVQTGAVRSSGGTFSAPDLEYCLRAAGIVVTHEDERQMVPYLYQPACSPHLAARLAGERIDISRILSCIAEIQTRHDFIIAEGAGGILVPLSEQKSMADLAKALNFPVIVVATRALGTLNHTLLTLEALRSRSIPIFGLILNDVEPVADEEIPADNEKTLASIAQVPLLFRVPYGALDFKLPQEVISAITSESSGNVTPENAASHITEELSDIRKSDIEHLWHPFTDITAYQNRENYILITSADGIFLEDSRGVKYLDGISSWWCANLGHRHPRIVAALKAQAARLPHCILGGIAHPEAVLLADELAQLLPGNLNHVFYASDGSSAVEAALKIALQYYSNRGESGKTKFACLEHSYHGDTFGAVSVGYVEEFHRSVRSVLWPSIRLPSPSCVQCPFGRSRESCDAECFAESEKLLRENSESLAGVIVEPLCQAAGGMRIYSPRYLTRLSDLCRTLGILLIADEIAVGFGRTGSMFACEQARIVPDIMTIGKGLTGGTLPMSAAVVTDGVYDMFRNSSLSKDKDKTLFHGHTFSGNPLAAACARAALRVYQEEDVLGTVTRNSPILSAGFSDLSRSVPGSTFSSLGLIGMMELPMENGGVHAARLAASAAVKRGLFIRPLANVLYLYPPLTSTRAQLRKMIGILAESLEEISNLEIPR